MNKDEILWIHNARIIAAFAVIMIHVSSQFVSENQVGTWFWWTGNFFDAVARWAVPVFVMISGMLLLSPKKAESFSEFYKKRLNRILIPTLSWTVFFVSYEIFTSIRHHKEISIAKKALSLLNGHPFYHLWFLYMLIGLYLFTPFLRKAFAALSKQEQKALVILLFLCAASHTIFYCLTDSSSKSFFINMFLPYLPYFLAGSLIAQTPDIHSIKKLASLFLSSVVLSVMGFYLTHQGLEHDAETYFYEPLGLSTIAMSFSAFLLLKKTAFFVGEKLTITLSSLSLGIYLVHPFFLLFLSHKEFLPDFFNPTVFDPLFSIPFMSFITFGMSAFFCWIISHIPYIRRII